MIPGSSPGVDTPDPYCEKCPACIGPVTLVRAKEKIKHRIKNMQWF